MGGPIPGWTVSIPQAGLDILKAWVADTLPKTVAVSIPQAGLDILKEEKQPLFQRPALRFQSRKQD